MALEQVNQVVKIFTTKVAPSTEISLMIQQGLDKVFGDESESGLHYITRTYIAYLRVLQCIGSLSSDDIKKITDVEKKIAADNEERARANNQQAIKGSAAKFDEVSVLEKLGENGRRELFDLAIAGVNPNSEIFKKAMEECVSRLVKGSQLANAGESPTDVNPNFLAAYFGHTLGLAPRAMVHFVISHYLTRTFQAKYKGDPDLGKIAFDKDAIHDVIGVGIRILNARGDDSVREITEMWGKLRQDGGLQWHNDKYDNSNRTDPKQWFYDAVFGQNKKLQ
ncbi:hypothetical protein IT418_01365 [bacterium]|nr:hypothetical protein [bacterium]